MPVYAYKGVTQAGRSTRGFVDAESARAARVKLRRDGVFLTDLSESAAAPPTVEKPGKGFVMTIYRRRAASSPSPSSAIAYRRSLMSNHSLQNAGLATK